MQHPGVLIRARVFCTVRAEGSDIIARKGDFVCRRQISSRPQVWISFPVEQRRAFLPINGYWLALGKTVNEIAAGAATKSTLRVDEICGDAADEILPLVGLGESEDIELP